MKCILCTQSLGEGVFIGAGDGRGQKFVHEWPCYPIHVISNEYERNTQRKLRVEDYFFLSRSGSHAYGLNGPQSDEDFFGAFYPLPEHLFGITPFDHWNPDKGEDDNYDFTLYSIRKYVQLLLKGNPNVVETLFFPDEVYAYRSERFLELQDIREAFLTTAFVKSTKGYADSQLGRMTRVGETRKLGKKRKELVEKYGFDTHNASHLIRLLSVCINWLETGDFNPHIKDEHLIKLILCVKRGEYKAVEVEQMGEELFHHLKHLETTCYIREPNLKLANQFLITVHKEVLCRS